MRLTTKKIQFLSAVADSAFSDMDGHWEFHCSVGHDGNPGCCIIQSFPGGLNSYCSQPLSPRYLENPREMLRDLGDMVAKTKMATDQQLRAIVALTKILR